MQWYCWNWTTNAPIIIWYYLHGSCLEKQSQKNEAPIITNKICTLRRYEWCDFIILYQIAVIYSGFYWCQISCHILPDPKTQNIQKKIYCFHYKNNKIVATIVSVLGFILVKFTNTDSDLWYNRFRENWCTINTLNYVVALVMKPKRVTTQIYELLTKFLLVPHFDALLEY